MKKIRTANLLVIKYLFVVVIGCALTFNSNAQYTKLVNFNGAANGSNPQGSLISDGTFLYGMTYNGGLYDLGTIFKVKPNGTSYSKLLDFDGTNGSNPYGSLISDGTFLYGMTYNGGTNDSGVILKIKPDGTGYLKILDFAGPVNGSNPQGTLISDGTFLYGVTTNGGVNTLGVLFKIMPDGSGYSKLLDFAGTTNGSNPRGTLFSSAGFLYGMTYGGGVNNLGTIFKIMPNGTGFTKLFDFSGVADGSYPFGSLISDGTFMYGMTYQGGTNDLGTIFKIMPDGTGFSWLIDCSGIANGSYPFGSLIMDGSFLYGMTYQGGTNDLGVFFRVKPDGTTYSKLIDCSGAANGSYPLGSFISDGNFLHGMTSGGGTSDMGTLFNYQLPSTITSVAASSFTVCAGGSNTASYNAGGIFNPGNIFITQLSDASGSFSSPVNMDSVISLVSGTIPFTIPSSTPGGTGYRIRVISTDPIITSADNGLDITVIASPTITSTAPASRCDAGTVILGATASAGTLDWYASSLGGSSLGTGATFTTPTLTTTATYYTSSIDNSCESPRTAVTATVTVVLTTTPASRCDAGTVILGATASAGTLDWYASSSGGTSLGTGINFTTPIISSTATYYVDATYASCTSLRTAVVATVNLLPVINASGNTTICATGSAILTASGGTQYLWSPGGETTTSISVSPTNNTTYTVSVSGANNCSDTSHIAVTLDPCTGVPSISNEQSVTIYPNPFISTATVVLKGIISLTDVYMTLYDAFGREIKKMKIDHTMFEINLEGMMAGIYFYRVDDVNGKIFSTGKIVIE